MSRHGALYAAAAAISLAAVAGGVVGVVTGSAGACWGCFVLAGIGAAACIGAELVER